MSIRIKKIMVVMMAAVISVMVFGTSKVCAADQTKSACAAALKVTGNADQIKYKSSSAIDFSAIPYNLAEKAKSAFYVTSGNDVYNICVVQMTKEKDAKSLYTAFKKYKSSCLKSPYFKTDYSKTEQDIIKNAIYGRKGKYVWYISMSSKKKNQQGQKALKKSLSYIPAAAKGGYVKICTADSDQRYAFTGIMDEQPELSPVPEPAETPELSPTPEPFETLELSPTPEPAETPELSPTPEPAEIPELSPTPESTVTPERSPSPDPVLSGLVKKNGRLRYYVSGKPVKNKLIKNKNAVYYFGSNGYAISNKWKTVSGNKYYFKANSKAATGSYKIGEKYRVFRANGRLCANKGLKLVEVKGRKYMVKKDGYAAPGWHIVGDGVLHAMKSGRLDTRKKCSYIKLDGEGYAVDAEQAMAKVLAAGFIAKHTAKTDLKVTKFRKCFRAIIGGNSYLSYWRPQGFGKKNWQYRSAIEMFRTGLTGDCYGISCAVAACAKELGYQPYVIWAANSHSFVIVDGKYYDNMHGAKFGTTTHDSYTVREKFKF